MGLGGEVDFPLLGGWRTAPRAEEWILGKGTHGLDVAVNV